FEDLVDKAIATGCTKIQLFKPHFAKNAPDYIEKACKKAHEHGIAVNVFYADDLEEAKSYLNMGADVILTNDYQRVARAADGYEKYYLYERYAR
nr:hypothetical protein [Clostridia bacterium]